MLVMRKCRSCGKQFDTMLGSKHMKCKNCREEDEINFSQSEIEELTQSKTLNFGTENFFNEKEPVSEKVDLSDDVLNQIDNIFNEYESNELSSKYTNQSKVVKYNWENKCK